MGFQIQKLFLSQGHNYFGRHGMEADTHELTEVTELECVAGHGIRGDRFFDYKPDYKGQITFFSLEVFETLCRELSLRDVDVSATRRNVITQGVDLNSLVGKEFDLQGLRFRGIEECRPCYWMNSAIGEGSEQWLKGRGGLRAQILSDGVLRITP
jgi:MOSC domain-containing protein YiiM